MAKAGLFGLGRKADVGGPVLDMSDTGMRFLSSEKPALGSVLKIVVRLGPIGATLEVKGAVRWAHAGADGKMIVGIEFDRLTDDDRAKIQRLRERLLNTPTQG